MGELEDILCKSPTSLTPLSYARYYCYRYCCSSCCYVVSLLLLLLLLRGLHVTATLLRAASVLLIYALHALCATRCLATWPLHFF